MKNALNYLAMGLFLMGSFMGCKTQSGLSEKQLKDIDTIEEMGKLSQVQSDSLQKLVAGINLKVVAEKVWCSEEGKKADQACINKMIEPFNNPSKRKIFDDKILADMKKTSQDQVMPKEVLNAVKEFYNLSNMKDLTAQKFNSGSKEMNALAKCVQHDFTFTVTPKAPEPVPMPSDAPSADGKPEGEKAKDEKKDADKAPENVAMPAPVPMPVPFQSCYKNVLSPIGDLTFGVKASN